jgi:unsaturated rhamnogalacturonyl hydrolase
MQKKICLKRSLILIFFLITEIAAQIINAQPVVGLDNWFNNESDIRTGNPFHYLWTDTSLSGYSGWGDIFRARGASISTIGKPDSETLNKIDIYIIVDPDTTTEASAPNYIDPEDIKAIRQWVEDGGVLAVLGNDAPNCEFTHLNMLMKQFGMSFNHVTLHRVNGTDFDMGACSDLPDNSLFKGVTKIYIKEISDINLSGNAKPLLTEKGKVLMAENKYGKGYVFAVGDPWIYNEYIDHDRLPDSFNNRKAAENLTDLLLGYVKKR